MKNTPISTAKELRQLFLQKIANGEKLTFTLRDSQEIISRARQNEINKRTN